MKKIYPISDDLFLAVAFIAFVVAVITRLLDISPIIWRITPFQLFNGAMACLLFSIALSLRDIAQRSK